VERRFVDWSQPFLVAAAEILVERAQRDDLLDLSKTVLVFPGARAGRRFLDLLLRLTEHRRLHLDPPRCVTPRSLLDLLVVTPGPVADALTREMAWIRALREAPAETVAVFAPAYGPDEDLRSWSGLASLLDEVARELWSEGLSFARVLEHSLPLDTEERRWQALAEIERRYLDALTSAGYRDPAREAWDALAQERVQRPGPIVLMAVADLGRAARALLGASGDDLLALVYAPAHLSERFDEFGCIRVEPWCTATLELGEEQILVADRPADQADAVLRCLEDLDPPTMADVTIGVADAELVVTVQQALAAANLPAHVAAGHPLERTEPFVLLDGIARLLRENRFEDLAALARHPRIGSYLELHTELAHDDPLTQLDRYYAAHLPSSLADLPPASVEGRSIDPILEGVRRLLEPLAGAVRPARAWARPVLAVLVDVYEDPGLDTTRGPDRLLVEVLDRLAAACRSLATLPPSLSPPIAGHEAVDLLLRAIRGLAVPRPPDDDAVEILGWLELPLDDAPVLVVVGMNEGKVPEAIVGDAFLPDGLRAGLGLPDNRRRYARDAYALAALAGGPRRLRLVAGERSARLDPLRPSRLLLACPREPLAARILRFTSVTEGELSRARPLFAAGDLHEFFRIPPRPDADVRLASMSVSGFGRYLRCPYRFYLEHVLRLRALDDAAQELDAAAFGRLAHDVLMAFGRGPVRHAANAREISGFLSEELQRRAREQFGSRPRAALRIQLEQLRARLRRFARWQASRVRAGWRIDDVEVVFAGERAQLLVDGVPMEVRGRIDRIDRHVETGRTAIVDYKTADRARSPDEDHRDRTGRWVDLQLPLYAYLLGRRDGVESASSSRPDFDLAYITLPKNLDGIGYAIAPWTRAELAQAMEVAHDVVRRVRRAEFWPPSPPPPAFDPYGAICLDAQFHVPALDEPPEAP
jgi:ATP-dependent helicase/nuclease subunit B